MTDKDDDLIDKSNEPWISKSDITWLTTRAYKVLLVTFVLEYLFGKYFDGTVDDILMGSVYISLALILIAQIVGIIIFFKGKR